MKKSDLAWAAGLYEGEGSTGCYRCGVKWLQMRLTISMTDREPVERFAAFFGLNVMGPWKKQAPSGRPAKDAYVLVASGDKAVAIFRQLRPWLSPRRQQQGDQATTKWENR